MNRRVFKEHNFKIEGNILPLEDFKLFCDRGDGLVFSDEIKIQIISAAEKLPDKEYPVLYSTEYMMYRTNGNRTVYEGKFFERRKDMLTLALAEYLERQGRFTLKLCDLVWMILEETTWVVPAHNRIGDENGYLTYAFKDEVDYIDLFSAVTGAYLAWVYYLCDDILDGVTPLIRERILYELDKKIIRPYNKDFLQKMQWAIRKPPNNWCPWIVSNILNVCALTVADTQKREEIVNTSLELLDKWIFVYHPDGGCDEGPGYWGAAGGALYNACLVLYDMSDGYINVFKDPLVVNIAEYIAKAYVCDDYFMNFADNLPRLSALAYWHLDFALMCDSKIMESYARARVGGKKPMYAPKSYITCPYREMRSYAHGTLPPAEYIPPTKVWLDGLGVAVTREYPSAKKGLYLAFKGGHNNESHNHNDVGNIIVFADGQPIFIDLGVGEYTSRTFRERRYEIPSMRSEYHNVPSFNGVCQEAGRNFAAKNYIYNQENGALELDATDAYPPEAGLEKYTRRAALEGEKITVTDRFTLRENGNATFNLITRVYPTMSGNSFMVEGKKITFDPSLVYEVEEIVCDEVETRDLPFYCNTEKLWRIKLSANNIKGGEEQAFSIVIE